MCHKLHVSTGSSPQQVPPAAVSQLYEVGIQRVLTPHSVGALLPAYTTVSAGQTRPRVLQLVNTGVSPVIITIRTDVPAHISQPGQWTLGHIAALAKLW